MANDYANKTIRCFSPETYQHLLGGLKALGRTFCSFETPKEQGLLLRHDVDYDLGLAARLAEINQAHGVSATFFILVGSMLYNPFNPPNLAAIETIIKRGQHIGLHYHHKTGTLDTGRLERELSLLKFLIPTAQRVVAWHNPVAGLENLNVAAEALGVTCAYAPCFFSKDRYISDSNRRHDTTDILAFASESKAPTVQVLIHPLIWMRPTADMLATLSEAFVEQQKRIEEIFSENSCWKNIKNNAV